MTLDRHSTATTPCDAHRLARASRQRRTRTLALRRRRLRLRPAPETQLADLAGCRFRFDALNRCWLPERDAAGRSSVRGVYLAGDGAGIAGADAAELAGRRAALALLEDLGIAHRTQRGQPDAASLERELQRIAVFRAGLEPRSRRPRMGAQLARRHDRLPLRGNQRGHVARAASAAATRTKSTG